MNPSNPASHALSENTLARLKQAVEKNPDLIILTDDVYGIDADDVRMKALFCELGEKKKIMLSIGKN